MGSQSSMPWDPNCVLPTSKTIHPNCVCSAHQNVVLLVDPSFTRVVFVTVTSLVHLRERTLSM